MTTVTFLTEESRIIGFDAKGHSGYAAEGEDIVCAAVTSAVRLVEATVNDVMGLCAAVKVNQRDTTISLRLPGGLAQTAESTCQNLLTGLMVYLTQLHDEYPDHIEVMASAIVALSCFSRFCHAAALLYSTIERTYSPPLSTGPVINANSSLSAYQAA